MKWRRFKSRFKVKVSYRKSLTRGTIALPAPILAAWGCPEYVEFSASESGDAVITPIAPLEPTGAVENALEDDFEQA